MSDLSTKIFEATHDNKAVHLTDQEQASLAALLGKRCNKQTKSRLAYKLSLPLYIYRDYGIFRRVSFDNGQAEYCAGQSYTDEIRTVRELILNN
jgi:hypothetical protein